MSEAGDDRDEVALRVVPVMTGVSMLLHLAIISHDTRKQASRRRQRGLGC